eukprot:CAMPEP_0201542340 /NCGR_PEP_ID=MMETSP0161_2-20130828/71977_1 /ASSEMBLY_ACC=CAM_ASM_000251 /TAXON_ID=180227 /ORGANISM="Neoparamoeba aestuarina, Strain SoJaBio B1-5/56/2" /LENGTH=370 /DNA_ID=CAMNT_0047949977 /DNA_START=33 /DNA_END=1146 /DNA_ORIENTATION=+
MIWRLSRRTLIFLTGSCWGGLIGVTLTLSIQEQYAIAYQELDKSSSVDESTCDLERKCKEVGYPSNENIYITSSYVCSFSPFLRTPSWVMEYVSQNKTIPKSGRSKGNRNRSAFFAESAIQSPFRASNSDYQCGTEIGLSRGHLAPAQMHKETQKEVDDTFNLSLNIVPQFMSTNGCDWYRLETMVKKLSKKYEEAWVITGPAFIPIAKEAHHGKKTMHKIEFDLIGEKRVAVPTHLFKIILGKSASPESSFHCAAFLLPNGPIVDEAGLTRYQIDIDELESYTGLNFFTKIRTRALEAEKIKSVNPMSLLLPHSSSSFKDMCKEEVCEGKRRSVKASTEALAGCTGTLENAESGINGGIGDLVETGEGS